MASSFLPSLLICCTLALALIPSIVSASSINNCSHLSEQAEGPYWLVEDIKTSNIRRNLSFGVPLNLTLKVADAAESSRFNRCVPITRARVDIWQARYDGLYSDEELDHTQGQTWLRGYQLTDNSGYAIFQTIYPGWYEGRTVHIHLRVRLYNSDGSTSYDDTTQLYFDDDISDAIFKNVYPYNDRSGAVRDTYNSADSLFTSNNIISLTGSYLEKRGYSSTVELSVPFSDSQRDRAVDDAGKLARAGASHGVVDSL